MKEIKETKWRCILYSWIARFDISNVFVFPKGIYSFSCAVTQLYLTLCDPMDCSTAGFPVLHHLPECANSCPLSWWYRPTISPSDTFFILLLPQSLPVSGTFPISWLFMSDDQNTGASASASALPSSIQSWFALRLISLISLLSRGLSEAFSSTTVWRCQFFGVLLSLWSSSHNCTWLVGRP